MANRPNIPCPRLRARPTMNNASRMQQLPFMPGLRQGSMPHLLAAARAAGQRAAFMAAAAHGITGVPLRPGMGIPGRFMPGMIPGGIPIVPPMGVPMAGYMPGMVPGIPVQIPEMMRSTTSFNVSETGGGSVISKKVVSSTVEHKTAHGIQTIQQTQSMTVNVPGTNSSKEHNNSQDIPSKETLQETVTKDKTDASDTDDRKDCERDGRDRSPINEASKQYKEMNDSTSMDKEHESSSHSPHRSNNSQEQSHSPCRRNKEHESCSHSPHRSNTSLGHSHSPSRRNNSPDHSHSRRRNISRECSHSPHRRNNNRERSNSPRRRNHSGERSRSPHRKNYSRECSPSYRNKHYSKDRYHNDDNKDKYLSLDQHQSLTFERHEKQAARPDPRNSPHPSNYFKQAPPNTTMYNPDIEKYQNTKYYGNAYYNEETGHSQSSRSYCPDSREYYEKTCGREPYNNDLSGPSRRNDDNAEKEYFDKSDHGLYDGDISSGRERGAWQNSHRPSELQLMNRNNDHTNWTDSSSQYRDNSSPKGPPPRRSPLRISPPRGPPPRNFPPRQSSPRRSPPRMRRGTH